MNVLPDWALPVANVLGSVRMEPPWKAGSAWIPGCAVVLAQFPVAPAKKAAERPCWGMAWRVCGSSTGLGSLTCRTGVLAAGNDASAGAGAAGATVLFIGSVIMGLAPAHQGPQDLAELLKF